MIRGFADKHTENLYHGRTTGKRLPWSADLCKAAQRKLDMLEAATRLEDLRVPPGNHLEALSGNWGGYHSIRINAQFRIVFKWFNNFAFDIQLVDYH